MCNQVTSLITYLTQNMSLITYQSISCRVATAQGKQGKRNLVLTFSRQGKHREFCFDTGKNFETQGKYFSVTQGKNLDTGKIFDSDY